MIAAQVVSGQPVLTLEQAVRQAVERYPAVRGATERANAAAAAIQLARTAYLPRAEAIAQVNRATTNNVYGMLRAVESGFGIASVPDYMARENPSLVKVLPELQGPSFEVYFIYPSDLKRSKRIAAFRQFLIDQASDWEP